MKTINIEDESPYCDVCGTCGYIGCCGIRNFVSKHIKGKTNCKNEDLIISELIDLCDYKDYVFKQNDELKKQVEEKDKEIERLNNNMQILQDDLDIIGKELGLEEGSCFEDVLDSIDRLNNIIDELEKELEQEIAVVGANRTVDNNNPEWWYKLNCYNNILDKLKELKEGK